MELTTGRKNFLFSLLVSISALGSILIAGLVPLLSLHAKYPNDQRYAIAWSNSNTSNLINLAIDGILMYGLLFGVGFLAGYLRPGHAWRWGISALALMPLVIVINLIEDKTSHNLLPLELMSYGVWILGITFGAWLGGQARRLINHLSTV